MAILDGNRPFGGLSPLWGKGLRGNVRWSS